MASSCKLCQTLTPQGENPKKEALPTNETKDNEMMAHIQVHRRHLRLINGSIFSTKELLEKCYSGKRNDNTNHSNGDAIDPDKLSRTGKLKKSKPSSHRFVLTQRCLQMFGKSRNDYFVNCTECDRKLVVRTKKNGKFTFTAAINHACIHLGKRFFVCRRCNGRFSNKHTTWSHLRDVHNLRYTPENYVDSSNDYQAEILDMLEQCFGQSRKVVTKSGRTKDSKLRSLCQMKRSLFNFCRCLFTNCDRKTPVSCSECGASLTMFKNGYVNTNKAIDHVCVHLRETMFTCRHCDRGTVSESGMRQHLSIVHKISVRKESYNDLSPAYYKQIKAMLKRCFGREKKKSSGGNDLRHISNEINHRKISVSETNKVNSRAGATPLAKRNLLCYHLIRKHVQKEILKCRVCSKGIKVVQIQHYRTIPALQHALGHLKKPLYTCQHCVVTKSTVGSIRWHTKVNHNVIDAVGYDEKLDDFQSEILDILTKCYDWDQK